MKSIKKIISIVHIARSYQRVLIALFKSHFTECDVLHGEVIEKSIVEVTS